MDKEAFLTELEPIKDKLYNIIVAPHSAQRSGSLWSLQSNAEHAGNTRSTD